LGAPAYDPLDQNIPPMISQDNSTFHFSDEASDNDGVIFPMKYRIDIFLQTT
jgi:hypothetical protein